MKYLLLIVALLPSAAFSQVTAPVYRTTAGQAVEAQGIFCPDPAKCGGSGGGGGSSDATAANQSTQIAAEQAIRDRIGATTAPAAGSTNALLTTIAASVAAPLPAGSATIGNVGGLNTPASAVTGGGNRTGGADGAGNYRDLQLSTGGVLDSPRAGTANRVVTKTSIAANTSTSICPAQAAVISTEIYFTTAGVGISLAGGTLTTATIGTTASTTPDLSFATANTLYTLPVPPTNAITAYGAAGIVVCIQNLRQ